MLLNLDNILKNFEKTFNKLEAYEGQCDQESSTARQAIAREEQHLADVEANRAKAATARQKVGEILGK